MPWPAATRILTGVGAGLAHAHRTGVIHGDVKPGNVFVTVDGSIKLLDFGQANAVSRGRRPAGKLSISPAYASCELHEGRRPEIRDDVFALAVMAYRIIAGARPFGRYTPLDAEQAGIQALRPAGMATAEWRALQQGLAWRREQRPDSVADFVAAVLPKQSLDNHERVTSLYVAALLG
jgi:serine/threonine protein kinase